MKPSKGRGRQAAVTRLSICLLSTLMLLLAALGCYGCYGEPEAIGGPDLESETDTFVWTDTTEHEVRVIEIREDSVVIVELRTPRDTNRVYTEKRYTAEELDDWQRDIAARVAQVRIDLIDALEALIADSL